jgi:hypothetical protein
MVSWVSSARWFLKGSCVHNCCARPGGAAQTGCRTRVLRRPRLVRAVTTGRTGALRCRDGVQWRAPIQNRQKSYTPRRDFGRWQCLSRERSGDKDSLTPGWRLATAKLRRAGLTPAPLTPKSPGRGAWREGMPRARRTPLVPPTLRAAAMASISRFSASRRPLAEIYMQPSQFGRRHQARPAARCTQ